MADYQVVGKNVPRPDVWDKVVGRAGYAVDLSLPGMLVGKIVRSPYPHARIVNVDTSRAERLPGVKAVVTGGQSWEAKKEILPMRPGEQHILATDKVRYIGDEVAALAAVSEEVAEEALELIKVEYQELPAYFDPREAVAPGAERIHDANGNIAAAFDIVRGDPEKAFSQAEQVFEDSYSTHMQHQGYLEPMACLADVDASGKLAVWVASMDPSGVRLSLAKVLGMPESKIRVIQAYVGGAFGGKITMLPIYPIAALLAMRSGRPVKIVYTREEDFIATLPRISVSIELRTGWKKDGTWLAKQVKIVADNGAYLDRGPRIVAQMMVSPDCLYRIKDIKAEAKVVYTNKAAVGAMRGFGGTHMLFAQESHLDRVACELGIDSAELRLKNATRVGDVTAHGWEIHSCGLAECIEEVTGRIGWKEKKGRAGKGLGMACVTYDTDARQAPGFGGSLAYVEIMEDGKVKVVSGEADYGQGWNMVAAQIAAEQLGLPYQDVQVTTPDTDFTPYSNGPWGLRVTVSGGNAVKLAAEDARRKLLQVAAEHLEASPNDLEIKDRKVQVRGTPQKAIPVATLAREQLLRRGGSAIIGRGLDEYPGTNPRHPVTLYGNTSRAYNFGAQAVEVEVDEQTGIAKVLRVISAHDLGKAINPASCEGQIEGSIVTGLGYATTEKMIYDQGQLANPNFCDYRMPTAADVPPLESVLVETLDPNTPFGAKSIGQPATMMPPPAMANAIYDALGVRLQNLPFSYDAILSRLEGKRAGSPSD